MAVTNPDEPRFRLNVKQTAKNLYHSEVTVEYKSDKIRRTTNPDDPGDVVITTLGAMALSLIKETEKAFREDGRKFVGDET